MSEKHCGFSARLGVLALCATAVFASLCAAQSTTDSRLKNAYRFQKGGWTYVHLEGSPSEIGFQHGYLLAPEIADDANAAPRQVLERGAAAAHHTAILERR